MKTTCGVEMSNIERTQAKVRMLVGLNNPTTSSRALVVRSTEIITSIQVLFQSSIMPEYLPTACVI